MYIANPKPEYLLKCKYFDKQFLILIENYNLLIARYSEHIEKRTDSKFCISFGKYVSLTKSSAMFLPDSEI